MKKSISVPLLATAVVAAFAPAAFAQNPLRTLDWNAANPASARLIADAAGINVTGDLDLDKWSTTSKREKIESGDAKVKDAVRIVVESKPKNFWNAQLFAKTPVEIKDDDEIEVTFWMRAPKGDGSAKVIFGTWEKKPVLFFPKSGYGHQEINSIGPQWTRYSYTFKAKKDVDAEGSRVHFMFGDKAQTVEVGGVMIDVAGKTAGAKTAVTADAKPAKAADAKPAKAGDAKPTGGAAPTMAGQATNVTSELALNKWSVTSKQEKIESGDAKVKEATRVTVETMPKNFWSSQVFAKTPVDLKKGDEIEISFWLRAPKGDGIVKVLFSTWEKTPAIFFPKTGRGDQRIEGIGPEWKRYFYTFEAKKDVDGKVARLILMFGDKLQTVDVGDATINVAGKTGGAKETAAPAAATPQKVVLTGAQTPGDTTWLSSAKIADTGKVDYFKPGQTIGFLGDSLTHSSFYHQYIQLFLETRYPGHKLWTVNAGRSGDTTWGTLRDNRIEVDLKKAAPDIVFIHFGMNDVATFMFKKDMKTPTEKDLEGRRKRYVENLEKVVDEVQKTGAKAVVISPTIYENNDKSAPGANEELAVFAGLAAKVAQEKGAPFFDIYAPIDRYVAEQKASKGGWKFTNDNVHPNDAGYQLMSYLLIKGLQPQPFVYDVELDAATQKATAKGADVSGIKATPQSVSFALNEKSLPFPVTGGDKGLQAVPFDTDLNQQTLKITGLAPGNYALKIDGKEVAQAEAKALASGIDLAKIEGTPQFQRALKLREKILPEKFALERAQRDMASVMYNIPEVDWAGADDATGVAAFEKWVEKEKGSGGWKGYLIGQGRKNFPKRSEIAQRLAEIRAELAAMPTEMKHSYEVVAA